MNNSRQRKPNTRLANQDIDRYYFEKNLLTTSNQYAKKIDAAIIFEMVIEKNRIHSWIRNEETYVEEDR